MTKYLTPINEPVMSDRIGHDRVEIEEIERRTNTPLQDDWQGTLILKGDKERFSTEIEGIDADKRYFAVYERTETLTGEPIVKIHEITDVQNTKKQSA
ncbi:MAG: hypothetical protein ABEI98_05355 [Halorhabdus sp.]